MPSTALELRLTGAAALKFVFPAVSYVSMANAPKAMV